MQLLVEIIEFLLSLDSFRLGLLSEQLQVVLLTAQVRFFFNEERGLSEKSFPLFNQQFPLKAFFTGFFESVVVLGNIGLRQHLAQLGLICDKN